MMIEVDVSLVGSDAQLYSGSTISDWITIA